MRRLWTTVPQSGTGDGTVVDFDGTVTESNLAELAFIHFGEEAWEQYGSPAGEGRLTLEEGRGRSMRC